MIETTRTTLAFLPIAITAFFPSAVFSGAANWNECKISPTVDCVMDLAIDAAKHEDRTPSGYSSLGSLMAEYRGSISDMEFSNSLDGYVAESHLKGGFALGLLDQEKFKDAAQILGSTLEGTRARSFLVKKLISDGKLDEAASIAARGDRDGPRQELLGLVADAFGEAGSPEKGISLLLDEMKAVLDDDEDDIPGPLCWLLTSAAGLPVSGIDLPDAMVTASLALEVENTYRREAALEDVVQCLSGNGRFREALRTASFIEDEDDVYDLFGDIAGVMTKSGDLTGAFRVVDEIPASNFRHTLGNQDIARALIEIGDLKNAEQIIDMIEFTRPSGSLRAQLAHAFLKEGNEEKASENARMALEAYEKEDPGSFSAWLTLKYLNPVSSLIDQDEIRNAISKARRGLRGTENLGAYVFKMAAETLTAYGATSEALKLIENHIPEEKRLSALAAIAVAMKERENPL